MESRAVIKNETALSSQISIHDLANKVTSLLFKTRLGNNAEQNCAHLVEYTLECIKALLNGREPVKRTVTTEPSESSSTLQRKIFAVKKENGAVEAQLLTTKHIPNPSLTGLYSHLPYPTIPFVDTTTSQSTFLIDVDNRQPHRIRVNNNLLNETLKREAKNRNEIIYGDICLSYLTNKIGHVVAFVTDGDFIYYFDAQLFNGLTRSGIITFDDFKSAKINGNRAYWFSEEVYIPTDTPIIETCLFYLIYGGVKNMQSAAPIPAQTFQPPNANNTFHINGLDSIENVKKIAPQIVYLYLHGSTSFEFILNIPSTVKVIIYDSNLDNNLQDYLKKHYKTIPNTQSTPVLFPAPAIPQFPPAQTTATIPSLMPPTALTKRPNSKRQEAKVVMLEAETKRLRTENDALRSEVNQLRNYIDELTKSDTPSPSPRP